MTEVFLVNKRKLVFENGREFHGYSFGTEDNIVGELVFCTSMVGYQEIVTNPAYKGMIVMFTYPVIGSYGLSDEDYESGAITIAGLVVREYNDFPSNFRYTKTLAEAMEEYGVPGIYGLDTREITEMLRETGIIRAALVDSSLTHEEIKNLFIKSNSSPLLSEVSSRKIWYSRTPNYRYNVVALDCGITNSAIKSLKQRGCNVIVVPYDTSHERILSFNPHGIYISDGPGYPNDIEIVVNAIESLKGEIPILGVGLGMLAIAKAYGASIDEKRVMHFGSNHPVKNLVNEKIEIPAQNHSYIMSEENLKKTDITVTNRNIIDNTVEGIRIKGKPISAVAFTPEVTVDDTGTAYIYDNFLDDILTNTEGRN